MSPRCVLLATCLLLSVSLPGQAFPAKPPRTDRYGDPLPPGAIARLGTQRFHEVVSFALAPDGKTVLIEQRGVVRLCETATGKVLRTFDSPARPGSWFLDFSPDGRIIALGNGTTIRLRDARSGKPLCQFSRSEDGLFSADGKWFVSWQDDSTVRVWEVATGKLHRKHALPGRENPCSVAPTDSGVVLAAGVGRRIRVWDVVTGKELRGPPAFEKSMQWVRCSARGRVVASGREEERTVHLWDLSTGKRCRVQPRKPLHLVRLSPDGKVLAGTEEGGASVFLWDTRSGRALGELKTGNRVVSVIFCPDGRSLVVKTTGGLYSWSVAERKLLRRFACSLIEGSPRQMAFSRDGRVLAGIEGVYAPWLRVWDAATGGELGLDLGHTLTVCCIAFSADGQRVATADLYGSIRVWETVTGRPLRRLHEEGKSEVSAIVIAPGGKMVASYGHSDSTVRVWDVATGRERYHFKPHGPIPDRTLTYRHLLRFTPDGKGLAFANLVTPRIVFRETLTGKVRETIPGGDSITAFALSADGKRLAVWGDRGGLDGGTGITLWALGGRKARASVAIPNPGTDPLAFHDHTDDLLAFSPDRRLLAAAVEDKLRVWEVASGKLVGTFKGRGILGNPVFRLGGQLLGMQSDDRPCESLQIWDALQGKELRRFKVAGEVFGATAISPNARFVAGGLSDGTVLIWDLGDLARPGEKRWGKPGAAELRRWWEDLAAVDAARGYRAVRALRDAPESAVPFLAGRFVPATAERYPRLIKALDADSFAERQEAVAELSRLGLKAEPALRAVLKGKPSLEVRRRVEALLAQLDGPPAAAEVLWQGRALAVLEQVGTPAAAAVLKRLAGGAAEARLTQEAKAALGRLSKRPSEP